MEQLSLGGWPLWPLWSFRKRMHLCRDQAAGFYRAGADPILACKRCMILKDPCWQAKELRGKSASERSETVQIVSEASRAKTFKGYGYNGRRPSHEKWWPPSVDLSPHLERSTACQHFNLECYGNFTKAYPSLFPLTLCLSSIWAVLGRTCFHQTEGDGNLFDYIWNVFFSSGPPSTTENLIEWLQQRW